MCKLMLAQASQRTIDALAAVKARAVRLGRPRQMPDKVKRRILRARARGQTLKAIADRLNADQVPTAQGGVRWYPAAVAAVLRSSVAVEGISAKSRR